MHLLLYHGVLIPPAAGRRRAVGFGRQLDDTRAGLPTAWAPRFAFRVVTAPAYPVSLRPSSGRS